MKWIYNEIYVRSNIQVFIAFIISMIAIIILTIIFVNKEIKKEKNDNK